MFLKNKALFTNWVMTAVAAAHPAKVASVSQVKKLFILIPPVEGLLNSLCGLLSRPPVNTL